MNLGDRRYRYNLNRPGGEEEYSLKEIEALESLTNFNIRRHNVTTTIIKKIMKKFMIMGQLNYAKGNNFIYILISNYCHHVIYNNIYTENQ